MQEPQLRQLYERLQARAAASGVSEAAAILSRLVGMATNDPRGALLPGVADCVLAIQLRADAPPEVVGHSAGKLRSATELAGREGSAERLLLGTHPRTLLSALTPPPCPAPCPFLFSPQAVLDLCSTYDANLGHHQCSMHVAMACLEQLGGAAPTPAAVLLHGILLNVWRKPVS